MVNRLLCLFAWAQVLIFIGLLLAALGVIGPAHAGASCPAMFFRQQQPAVAADQVLCYQAYAVGYRAATLGPSWAAERLTPDGIADALAERRHCVIGANDAVPGGPTNADYTGSGYDRGHMAPAGDVGRPDAQQETCLLTNMVPQLPELNRQVWRTLEDQVRGIGAGQEAWVVTGPIYGPHPQHVGRVPIPAATWKAVRTSAGGVAYLATNADPVRCWLVPIPVLEQTLNAKIFAGSPAPFLGLEPVSGCDRVSALPDVLHVARVK